MSKSSLLVVFASLLGACVINSDDSDDDAGETSNVTSSPTSTSTTSTTSTTTSTTTSATDDTTGAVDSTGAVESTEATADSSGPSDTTSAPTGPCGWGQTGQKVVDEGYICGGDGADPAGLNPIDCPVNVELIEGGDCGGEMGITGVGCCDGSGNVWFCADNGAGRVLYTDVCGG